MRTSSRLSQTLDFFGRIGDKMKLPDDDHAAIAQVLTDYYRAFSTLDAQAVLPYFHEPSQLISAAGVVPTPTRDAVAAAFQPVMDALRSRGFIRSELVDLHLKRLSATTVIAGGVAVRRKTDGQELERAGVVYLLQRTSAGWQFATVAIHDAEDVLRPE
jgi:ketosteroid isomerase-like protein